MKISTGTSLEDILFEEGALTSDQLAVVKLEYINTGKSLEEIIRSHDLVSEEQLLTAKAKILGIPYIDVANKSINPEVLNFLPEIVAKRYGILPFEHDKKENLLSVAMADPMDMQTIEFIEKKSKCRIRAYLASPSVLQNVIADQYAQSLSSEVTAALREAPQELAEAAMESSKKVGEIIREAPVTKIVSTLLEFAMKARASDIHIEPQEDKTRIRYRIDGILHEKLVLPRKVHDSVISRIKILADLKIDEKRIPQDGRFNFKIGEDEVDLRVSTLPTANGEKVVMRLLKKSGGVPTLQELGLRGTALKNLEMAMLKPHGIIIVCGPTGSGKTTTLYAVLSKINTVKVNIVTLEDPVEYKIAGVNQVQINPQAGLTFASGLRAFLRQDPNIILVGEIRDTETAELAIQAALTGHLVFSTLHTSSASGSLPRLLDMGAEPFLLASSMSALLGQRICRRICPDCKEEMTPPTEIVEEMKKVLGKLYSPDVTSGGQPKFYRGHGCDRCGKTGYLGRVGIFEVLPITDSIGKLILEHQPASAIEDQAIKEGMITMKQDGYLKVLEGITSLEEVLRVAQD